MRPLSLLAGLVPCFALLAPSAAHAAPSTTVVISSFRFIGPAGANDEFVLLKNLTDQPINIGNWELWGSNSSAGTAKRETVPSGTIIRPHGFYMFRGSSYSGAVKGDRTFSSGFQNDGGVAIKNTTGAVIDAVGLSKGSAYKEGTTLPPLTSQTDRGYQRRGGNCAELIDTDDNAADFEMVTPSTPLNSESCCGAEHCTNAPATGCFSGEAGTCSNFACVFPSKVDEPCDDGNACTLGDKCDTAGACKGTLMVCNTPSSPCEKTAGACSAGACVYAANTNAACDDGNACTTGDKCSSSKVCAGTAVSCNAPPTSFCDGNVSHAFASVGLCSDDGQSSSCTYTETVTSCAEQCNPATGKCVTDPCSGVVCNTPQNTCRLDVGTCTNGQCSYALKPVGTACNDGNSSTTDDVCNSNGVCVGTPPPTPTCSTPPSPKCTTNNTIARIYDAQGTLSPITQTCSYSFTDTACELGCEPATGLCKVDPCSLLACDNPDNSCLMPKGICLEGQCVYAPRPFGSICDDGLACTTAESCDGHGVCKAPSYANCGTAGSGGSGGEGGTAGSGGEGATSGSAGEAAGGEAGSGGDAGEGGSEAGSSGTGGTAGSEAGSSGTGGTGGSGGDAGQSGSGGDAPIAGSGGEAGEAGSGGAGGSVEEEESSTVQACQCQAPGVATTSLPTSSAALLLGLCAMAIRRRRD